jgi:hypothetical protein
MVSMANSIRPVIFIALILRYVVLGSAPARRCLLIPGGGDKGNGHAKRG